MTPNPHWVRWIYSSFVVYFKTQCAGIALPLFIPGETRDSQINDFVEFRIEGPYFDELTKGYWRIDAYIAMLLTMTIDDLNLYKLQTASGQVLAMFDKDIPMFRYNLDDSILGCMRLTKNSRIIQTNYGQIQPATPVTQSSIEAQYHMELSFIEERLTAKT